MASDWLFNFCTMLIGTFLQNKAILKKSSDPSNPSNIFRKGLETSFMKK
jgi:hypothetical protein